MPAAVEGKGLWRSAQLPDFQNLHRNKRSTLNLKEADGVAILKNSSRRLTSLSKITALT